MTQEPRRDFPLPEGDADYLDTLQLRWEAVHVQDVQDNRKLLIIEGWQIPTGYNVPSAALALVIPQGYPDTQIDMAYFSPALGRTDGASIRNLSEAVFPDEGTWQQWSRHRTPVNQWRPSVDDISTHLALVDDWLHREFGR